MEYYLIINNWISLYLYKLDDGLFINCIGLTVIRNCKRDLHVVRYDSI